MAAAAAAPLLCRRRRRTSAVAPHLCRGAGRWQQCWTVSDSGGAAEKLAYIATFQNCPIQLPIAMAAAAAAPLWSTAPPHLDRPWRCAVIAMAGLFRTSIDPGGAPLLPWQACLALWLWQWLCWPLLDCVVMIVCLFSEACHSTL